LSIYDLVYLGGKDNYLLSASHTKSLTSFLEQGKTLMVEPVLGSAQEACQKMLKKLDLKPVKLDAVSPLFSTPLPGR